MKMYFLVIPIIIGMLFGVALINNLEQTSNNSSVLNKENLIIAQAQFEFSAEQLERVKELVAAGTQPQANVFDSEATLANDEQQLTVSQNNYTLALLSLSQVLQVPFDGFDVEIIKLDAPSEALMYDNVQPILEHACSKIG